MRRGNIEPKVQIRNILSSFDSRSRWLLEAGSSDEGLECGNRAFSQAPPSRLTVPTIRISQVKPQHLP